MEKLQKQKEEEEQEKEDDDEVLLIPQVTPDFANFKGGIPKNEMKGDLFNNQKQESFPRLLGKQ